MAEKAKIEIPWESWLLKNQAYVNGDTKKGHTQKCKKAMWDIVMLMRPAIGYDWKWNGKRLQVIITAYRPSEQIDAQNLIDAVSDAIEEALRVDDREFDVAAVGMLDRENPRIIITIIEQEPEIYPKPRRD